MLTKLPGKTVALALVGAAVGAVVVPSVTWWTLVTHIADCTDLSGQRWGYYLNQGGALAALVLGVGELLRVIGPIRPSHILGGLAVTGLVVAGLVWNFETHIRVCEDARTMKWAYFAPIFAMLGVGGPLLLLSDHYERRAKRLAADPGS